MDQLVSLAKRRGFLFPSSEIYGGLNAVWDWGPLGTLMKQNLKNLWLEKFVFGSPNIVSIDTSILTRREVLQASGHEQGFSDPLVECRICHERYRADQNVPKAKDHAHNLTKPQNFNLMFKTYMGSVEESASLVYLRPETAQGMFVNFKLVAESMRLKPPFGIAQIGKAFRNEITVGNFIFRLREFEQAEIEYFIPPDQDLEWFDYWVAKWQEFFIDLGLGGDRVRIRQHQKEELAHYAKATSDVEFEFPFGWSELAGISNRTDFDLNQHINHSSRDLAWFDESTREKYIPFVIEPTLGIDRLILALLVNALGVSDGKDGREAGEIVLKLDPRIAPVKAAVFPLVKKDGLPEIASKIVNDLRLSKIGYVSYDESGSIGRRYRRQDEIGTPYCLTVDGQSKEDQTVTIRHRDTLAQERVPIKDLTNYLQSN